MPELLRRFALPYRAAFIIGPLTKLIEVLFDLATPLVIAHMVDAGIAAGDVSSVLRDGALLAVMALVAILIVLICQKMAARASMGIGTALRGALYRHINRLSCEDAEAFGTPSLVTRCTSDVNQIQLAVALAIRQLVRWPLLAAGSVIATMLIDVRLGAAFLVAVVLVVAAFFVVMRRSIPLFVRVQEGLDGVARIVREGLSGARVVRALGRGGYERERLVRAVDAQVESSIEVGAWSSTLNPVTLLVMNLAVCAVLVLGGIRVDAGELTQGDVVAFVNYATQALLSIVYVANLAIVFNKAQASARRVIEVLDATPSITDPAHPLVPDTEGAPAIRFDGVSYSYKEAPAPAVDGVSLVVPAGSTIGVIGGTGSGKTTLAELVSRTRDASSGSVEVFGADVRDWRLADLHSSVAVVPQSPSLVSGTIRSNLLWRDALADDAELWRALEAAQAAEFVRSMEFGLDSPVDAGGRNLSGGQRQRLTIARALVGGPAILIMDDAASALDAKTDARLRSSLRALAPSSPGMRMTTMVISQRIASVRAADAICVMEAGRVVGVGTHLELYRSCPVYREICDSQEVGIDG